MAVIGSGPAGFYTAYKVMSLIEHAMVDMYEHLPAPYGLVRYGVAPDHPEVKVRYLFASYALPYADDPSDYWRRDGHTHLLTFPYIELSRQVCGSSFVFTLHLHRQHRHW